MQILLFYAALFTCNPHMSCRTQTRNTLVSCNHSKVMCVQCFMVQWFFQINDTLICIHVKIFGWMFVVRLYGVRYLLIYPYRKGRQKMQKWYYIHNNNEYPYQRWKEQNNRKIFSGRWLKPQIILLLYSQRFMDFICILIGLYYLNSILKGTQILNMKCK
jgi:hypothetical protein